MLSYVQASCKAIALPTQYLYDILYRSVSLQQVDCSSQTQQTLDNRMPDWRKPRSAGYRCLKRWFYSDFASQHSLRYKKFEIACSVTNISRDPLHATLECSNARGRCGRWHGRMTRGQRDAHEHFSCALFSNVDNELSHRSCDKVNDKSNKIN